MTMARSLHGRPDGNTKATVSRLPGATSCATWRKALSIYIPCTERLRTIPSHIGTRIARARAPSRRRQAVEGANHREADVGPHVWRERHGQEAVLGHRGVGDLRETSRLLLREKGLEGLMHDLGDGRPIELGLLAEGLEPALFDINSHP